MTELLVWGQVVDQMKGKTLASLMRQPHLGKKSHPPANVCVCVCVCVCVMMWVAIYT